MVLTMDRQGGREDAEVPIEGGHYGLANDKTFTN